MLFYFNIFSLIVGILTLIFYNDPSVKEYFARINGTGTMAPAPAPSAPVEQPEALPAPIEQPEVPPAPVEVEPVTPEPVVNQFSLNQRKLLPNQNASAKLQASSNENSRQSSRKAAVTFKMMFTP